MSKVSGFSSPVPASALLVLLSACLAFIATFFLRSCPAIIALDLQATFNANNAQVALISSGTLLAYGIMQMPAGLITDYLGGRRTMVLFLVVAALATAAFGLAPNLSAAVAARFVIGLSVTIVPAAAAMLAASFPPERFTQAMGIFMASGGVGILLAAEPLARLSNAIGWRYSMLIAAAGTLVISIAVMRITKERRDAATPAASAAPKSSVSFGEIFKGMLMVLRNWVYWPPAIWQLCTAGVYFSLATMWWGPYLINGCGFTKVEASRIMLTQAALSLVTIPLLTTLADRTSRKFVMILCSALGLVAFIILVLFTGQMNMPALAVLVLTITTCATGGATCSFSLIRESFPPALTGTAVGCVNMLYPLGAAILSPLFGHLLKNRLTALDGAHAPAYSETLLIFAIIWGISLIAAFLLKEPRREK